MNEGKSVERIASVASFFISRIDVEVDKRLDALIKDETDAAKVEALKSLKGKVAVANGKIAYASYQEIFEGAGFASLKAKGAAVQRVLWAPASSGSSSR